MILGRKQQAQGMPIRPANLWSQEKNSVRATRLWWAFTAFDDILSGHQFGPVIRSQWWPREQIGGFFHLDDEMQIQLWIWNVDLPIWEMTLKYGSCN